MTRAILRFLLLVGGIVAIILLSAIAMDELQEHRDAREARYHACDMQVDHAHTKADTLATIQWCGDHGVLFAFNPKEKR